ncbi:MAG: hypothetical protein ACRD5D_07020, partial [Candidatus Polarisedimenticolia bacterium]
MRVGFDPASDDGLEVEWQSLGPVAGPGTRFDVVAGDVGALLRSRGFDAARCAAASTPESTLSDPDQGAATSAGFD